MLMETLVFCASGNIRFLIQPWRAETQEENKISGKSCTQKQTAKVQYFELQ